MYKLIALDMDGTLFNSDKQITDRTKETLAQARALGVKIVLASGRPLAGLQPPLKELDLIHEGEYVLSFNGALIVNTKTREIVSKCVLKGSDYKDLFKLSQELGVHCQAFSTRQGLITNETSQYTEHEASINKIDINIINPLTDITDEEDIIKVMFIDPPEILDEAIAKIPDWVKERYNVFKSAPFFFEITNKGVDKGISLLQLADYLNIKQSETMACGDQGNDYTMIKAAGLGVAMENGIDKVKAIANYVTDTNDNDGVAKAIEKFVLNK